MKGYLEGKAGGKVADVLAREAQNLPALVDKLGGTPQEVRQMERAVARYQQRLVQPDVQRDVLSALDLSPPDLATVVANTRPADLPPIVQAEQRSSAIDEAFDTLPPVEMTPPEPIVPASTPAFNSTEVHADWMQQYPNSRLQPVDFDRITKENTRAAFPNKVDFLGELRKVPAEQQYTRFQQLLSEVGPSQEQVDTVKAMVSEGRFDKKVADQILSGDLTRDEAARLIDKQTDTNRDALVSQALLTPQAAKDASVADLANADKRLINCVTSRRRLAMSTLNTPTPRAIPITSGPCATLRAGLASGGCSATTRS